MKESELKTKLLKELNKNPNAFFQCIPTAGPINAGKGTPDILGCISGQMYWIETKIFPNKPTPIQLSSLRKWALSSANSFVITADRNLLQVEFITQDDIKKNIKSYPILWGIENILQILQDRWK